MGASEIGSPSAGEVFTSALAQAQVTPGSAAPFWWAAASLAAGYILRMIVGHLLSRGRVRLDVAAQLREELRTEIKRKDSQLEQRDAKIDLLKDRLDKLDAALEKAEEERNQAQLALERYRLEVYKTLLSHGVQKAVLDKVLKLE